jgi:SAM-dependent methyltransferase
MNRGGFKDLTGIDPFIEKDIVYDCGVRIYKQHFLTFEGNFDFIMFHHSFEHMDEPLAIFEHIHKLLNPGCYALIRIPVADSFSKRKYGADWVNLDPPRHFYLHTTYSMNLLAKKSGLQLVDVVYDSLRLQFYGSELYRRDMTLHDYHSGKYGEVFSKQEMRVFKKEADRLNKAKDGDWACYFFRKPSD